MATEVKKTGIIRILEILHKHSDYDHKLTQKEIIKYLQDDYGITLERKAVSSNIEVLQEMGYDIISTENGSYMNSHEFEDSELRMLIDGVLSSKYITAEHSSDIIDKLCGLTNEHFKSHVKHIYSVHDWNKTDNQSLFYNIELIDEAISNGLKVTFEYNKYGVDKKLHKSSENIVSPYQMILHNQRYYLMGYNERWNEVAYCRIDHITNMKILDEAAYPLKKVPGYEKGIDYKSLSTARPYMYSDALENIVFKADAMIVDQIVDWFGDNALIKKSKDEEDKVIVSVKASPNAMEHWAMQYINSIEVTAPPSFRKRMQEVLQKGLDKYK